MSFPGVMDRFIQMLPAVHGYLPESDADVYLDDSIDTDVGICSYTG